MEKATPQEDTLWSTVNVNQNIVKLLNLRELNMESARKLKERCQFTASQLKRLELEKTLEGHQGCVNCLEWSSNGRYLASGSDDTHVRIWDPFKNKCLSVVPTKHIGNIFSVKFLGDGNLIATCAGDCKVIVQPVPDKRRVAYIDCSCHSNRVKRLATCPDQPSVFWSAGEDGLIIQYDLRDQHECSKNSVVFLDLTPTAEFKCIAVNPTRPHLMAVGANDCYVRLYDRRFVKAVKTSKLKLHDDDGNTKESRVPLDPNCVQYFAPGNLAKENAASNYFYKLVATYVAFDSTGNDMLVNLGGDHVYLYDINNSRACEELQVPINVKPSRKTIAFRPCCLTQDIKTASYNGHRHNYKYVSEASCACQYMHRVRRIQKRQWTGDVYFAAREYYNIIEQFPDYRDAYLDLIDCLLQLLFPAESKTWIEYYERKFPTASITGTTTSTKDAKDSKDARLEGLKEDWKRLPQTNGETYESGKWTITPQEKSLRLASRDYDLRYLGHCNMTTDIKEANFLGRDSAFICAGSDDGMIYIWDRATTNLLTALIGDVSIVNCVQPHPSISYLASSGIDHAIKIWSPCNKAECGEDREQRNSSKYVTKDLWQSIEKNQERMNNMDPFDTLLLNMGFRELRAVDGWTGNGTPGCRTS